MSDPKLTHKVTDSNAELQVQILEAGTVCLMVYTYVRTAVSLGSY